MWGLFPLGSYLFCVFYLSLCSLSNGFVPVPSPVTEVLPQYLKPIIKIDMSPKEKWVKILQPALQKLLYKWLISVLKDIKII